MRKILLCGFLIILCCPLYAQQKLIRELQQKLTTHPQSDTFRVNRLNELSEQRDLPLIRREALADEALVIAKKLRYAEGQGLALISKARARFDSGDRPGMDSLLKEAEHLIDLTNSPKLKIKYLLLNSRIRLGTGDAKKQIGYLMQAYQIAEKYNDKLLLLDVTRLISDLYTLYLSDFIKGLEWALKAEKLSEGHESSPIVLSVYSSIANVYVSLGENDKARFYFKKGLKLNEEIQLDQLQGILLNNMAEVDRVAGNYAEANKGYFESVKFSNSPDALCVAYGNISDVYSRTGNYPRSLKYAFKAIDLALISGSDDMRSAIYATLARVYKGKHMPDSAFYFAKKGYALAKEVGSLEYLRDNALALASSYEMAKDFENAYRYNKLYTSYRDSMINTQVTNKTGLLLYKYDLSKKEAQITKLNEEKKLQRYLLFAALAVLCSIALSALLLVRANRQKQKAFNLLSVQKQLIQDQRDETEQALAELKRTQDQLIRSEKMASLGELTAGIAHEIQNPLNFVNNFSGVSMELVDEMEDEIAKGDLTELAELAKTVKQNLGMIEQHGKRADNIVKGMLQHSRKGSSTKEPTDINKLADEYLRLAYHGLKAKDKTFNAELVTNFGADLPKINTVPQDLGRVLLNIFNNAFYAVQQQKKLSTTDHSPTVELSTAVVDNQITIKVRDNGAGIPDAIKDKIMQPFFTTKPTGEGTGLGLSLSYDIIVKGHGGTIDVKSEPGKFTEFIISLPVA